MYMEIGAQLSVLYITLQGDPQFSWKLLNCYITLANLVPYLANFINCTLFDEDYGLRKA